MFSHPDQGKQAVSGRPLSVGRPGHLKRLLCNAHTAQASQPRAVPSIRKRSSPRERRSDDTDPCSLDAAHTATCYHCTYAQRAVLYAFSAA